MNFACRRTWLPSYSSYSLPRGGYTQAFSIEAWQDVSGICTDSDVISSISNLTLSDSLIGMAVTGTNIQENSRVVSYDKAMGTLTIDHVSIGTASDIKLHNDFLSIWEIGGRKEAQFEVNGSADRRVILTSEGPVSGDDGKEYMEVMASDSIKDPTLFPSEFEKALSLKIAFESCLYLTAKIELHDRLNGEWGQAAYMARNASLRENQPDPNDAKWSARGAL